MIRRWQLSAAEARVAGTQHGASTARVDVTTAIGAAEAGLRATALIDGQDLLAVTDLLDQAARRLVPLVVRTSSDVDAAALLALCATDAIVLVEEREDAAAVAHLVARLVAERALLPVVLVASRSEAARELPRAALDLLGDPADLVPVSTAAQELLFGRHRRRVVRWFDLDRPVMRGEATDRDVRARQRAGMAPFFAEPAAALLSEIEAQVRGVQCDWSACVHDHVRGADVVVVASGPAARASRQLADQAPARGEPRIGAVTLRAVHPAPAAWGDPLRDCAAVVVVEDRHGALANATRAALAQRGSPTRRRWRDKSPPRLHAAFVDAGRAADCGADLLAFCRECARDDARQAVWLGLDFAPVSGQPPKRLVLHETLRRAFPGVERLGCAAESEFPTSGPLPLPARRIVPAQPEPTYDDITRHWEIVGALSAAGATTSLAPDPYLTAGAAPALTAQLRSATTSADASLPAFDPQACTACGKCWTSCPEGALLPTALGARALIEAGMQLAGAAAGVDAIRPVLPRLAKNVSAAVADGAGTSGAAIRRGGADVLAKASADKRERLAAAIEAAAMAIDALPVAATDALFKDAERQQPGTGALLALALDADACTGCEICVQVCEPDALHAETRAPELVQSAREGAAHWRALPGTAGALIGRAQKQEIPGLAGALLLSRHCLHAMAPGGLGGDNDEPGSGAQLALRLTMAAAEAHLQPLLQQRLATLDELREGLATRIRESLAVALPGDDLDALHDGLHTLGQGAVALTKLAERLDAVAGGGHFDAGRLRTFVSAARELADLRWRIETGRTGLGRARSGIVMGTDGVLHGAGLPWNAFAAPTVIVRDADSAARAAGIVAGCEQALADEVALVRRAQALLADGPLPPTRLRFADLTADERALAPPIFLCVDSAALDRGGLAAVATALASDAPIKVLVLAQPSAAAGPDPALLALAHRDAFVLQSTVAHADHLMQGVLAALRHPGGALVHVLAPSPADRGFAPAELIARTRGEVAARAFPLFSYDPSRPGAFGQKLSLAGNPPDSPDASSTASPVGRWATLQELAGVRTPFTQQIEAELRARVQDEHRGELQTMQSRHAEELAAVRREVERELLARLERRLTTLAGGTRP